MYFKMKSKLNLSSYGVEELSSVELSENNGGCVLTVVAVGVIVGLAAASLIKNKKIKVNNQEVKIKN
jgi:hypothetical protein